MTPHEAEKLLGGYATGTLDETERKALFAAAIEDQALFDALADEEALRELLADPAARAKLLAALDPPKAIPFWRRPGAMTLAASLVAAVGVSILLKHTKAPEMRQIRRAPTLLEEAPSPAPAQAPVPPAKAAPKLAPRERRAEPPPPPSPAPESPAQVQADAVTESKAAAAPAPAAANQAASAAPQERDKASVTGFASGVMAKRMALSPAWSFEGSGAARKLLVDWGPDGALVLVARAPEGDRVIAPLGESTLPDGRRSSRFAAPEDAPPLDLFWSPHPLAAYPAEGAVEGRRIRVWPSPK